MPHLTMRLLTALPLLTLLVIVGGLTLSQPGPAHAHHFCGNTGSPYGPFDLQTYEDGNYKTNYARTMELAGFNQLLPDRAAFALPALEGVQGSPYIPPVLLKSIAWIESGWAQASYDPPVQYGQVGPVLSSHDCGYGIMQVTSGMQNVSGVPNIDQAMIGGHYAFNIARGARILAEKWNGAPEFRPIVGSRNTQIIEDWYYALWSYNGFASKNHPLSHDPNRPPYLCDGTQPRGNYPYQELVFGCVAHPPVRGGIPLWPAQPVQLPNLADPAFAGLANWDAFNACVYNLQCRGMDIPTPNPWHTDPTGLGVSREQVIGTPSLSLSTGSITLAAVPGSESLPIDATVSNTGTGVLAWRATSTASWLRMSRSQGVSLGSDLGGNSHTLRVYANASGLPPGTYSGAVVFESLYSQNAQAVVPVTLVVDLQAASPHSGDFNGDGRTDLVFLCCSDYASLWVSNGAGGFAVSTFRPRPGYAMNVGSWLAGDFNGDGKTDLVHLLTPYDYAHTWISNGDGTFTVGTFRAWPGYDMKAGSWQSGDFNGDGKADVIHLTSADYANTWLSNGAHSFSVRFFRPGLGYAIQNGFWKRGDFNGDGRTDLIHVAGSDYAHPWLSNGDGTFSVAFFQPGPGYGMRNGFWQEGDFNGDGRSDLIHFAGRDYTHPWLSRGDGTFNVAFFQPWPGYDIRTGSWQQGDLNGDSRTDPIHLTASDYAHPWLSTGDEKFSVSFFRPWLGYVMQGGLWLPGDFNGDGKADLMHLAGNHANTWLSQGAGSFSVTTFHP